MIRSSCLCGTVTWSVPGPLPPMYHCHCSRCRKSHGAAFATYVDVPAAALSLVGQEAVASWGGGDGARRFCRSCGSVVPYTWQDTAFLPAGNFDGDPGARPARHIFTGSRARWYRMGDALPQFEAFYPPDREATPRADLLPLDPPGRPRGRCLCGAVAYVLEGPPIRRRYCHCGRCRKALSAAHAANMATAVDAVRFTRGEAQLCSYKLTGARFFTTVFCSGCGSPMPRRDRDRGIALIPLGSLDDEPGVPALGHIFVGSKAPWFDIADDLPQHQEYPPGG